MPKVATEHIYSEDGGRLLVAKGSVVPAGVEVDESKTADEEVRLSSAQEAALYETQPLSQERALEIAEQNAAIQVAERAKDAEAAGLTVEELEARSAENVEPAESTEDPSEEKAEEQAEAGENKAASSKSGAKK